MIMKQVRNRNYFSLFGKKENPGPTLRHIGPIWLYPLKWENFPFSRQRKNEKIYEDREKMPPARLHKKRLLAVPRANILEVIGGADSAPFRFVFDKI